MRPQHIVSVSGGKDSTATYLLALERGVPFRAVFADTGNEHELTYDYVRDLARKTGGPEVEWVKADFAADMKRKSQYIADHWVRDGVPPERAAEAIEALVPTGNPFLDMAKWKGRFPSSQTQFCTAELKVEPITRQVILPALRNGPVLQWLGIRAAESSRRARQPLFNRDDTGAYLWRPIFRWTLEDVWAMHKRHGIAPNPLYKQGMGRVGCMPCVNCRKNEIREIADRWPEHIDRVRRWEAAASVTAKRGKTTFFAATVAESHLQKDGIDEVVEWSRTGRGGRQYAMFFEAQSGGGCSHDLGLCERAA